LRLDRLAQVLQEMELVGDLSRLWRPFSCSLGKQTAAISTDDFDISR
jgi:hypothetical protein